MKEEAEIRKYILENYLFTDDENALGNDESFLAKGIVDSTGMMELIQFIEDRYEIKVNDEEMIPENLDSVNRVVAYVRAKQDGQIGRQTAG